MKRIIALMLTLLSIFLASCGTEGNVEEKADRPPAFSILQKETIFRKHTEKGVDTTFSEEEFADFLGEELTYITVNALPEATSGTLVFKGQSVMKGQTIPADSLTFLKFVPNTECKTASFGFTCDSAGYFGGELSCEMTYGASVNSPPVAANGELNTASGIACTGELSITEPNGDDFTVNVLSYPKDGSVTISKDGSIVYTPESGFSGRDLLVFTVTDRYGATSDRATLSITVSENEKNLVFADMGSDPNHIFAHRMCVNDTMVYRIEDGNYYFDPEKPVSKLDFLVMMMSVSKQDADIVAVADSAATDDSGLSSGLKGYLSAANEKGFIKLENGKFLPRETVTLSDAAFMISSALKLPAGSDKNGNYSALASLVKAGIVKTENGAIDGGKKLTKSDVAALLCRCEEYMTKNNIFRETD
jgi:hypothetical protein